MSPGIKFVKPDFSIPLHLNYARSKFSASVIAYCQGDDLKISCGIDCQFSLAGLSQME